MLESGGFLYIYVAMLPPIKSRYRVFPLSHAHVPSLHLLSRILKVKINIKSYQLIQHL